MRRVKKKNHTVRYLVVFIAIAIIFLAVFRPKLQDPLPEALKVVEVEKVAKRDITQTIPLIGTIKAKSVTMLTVQAGGKLEILVPSGSTIKKGEVVAVVHNSAIGGNYKLALQQLKTAQAQFDRVKGLYDKSFASLREVEDERNHLERVQRDVDEVRGDLAKAKILAPFDGMLGIFKVRDGTQVGPGEELVLLFNPTQLMVTFDIPYKILNKVHSGQRVLIDGQNIPLKALQPMIDPETHMAPAYIDFDCDHCVIGQEIELEIVVAKKHQVLTLDQDAVVFEGGKYFVFVVQDKKAIKRPVDVGVRSKDAVEITKGLHEDDLVVVHGQNRLYSGMEVRIANQAKS